MVAKRKALTVTPELEEALRGEAARPARGRPNKGKTPEHIFSPMRYREDKLMGRRLTTGAKPLVRLKPIHRQVFALHMSGVSNIDIATIVDRDPSWISTVLRDPLMRSIIGRTIDDLDNELRALFAQAVRALRDGLDPAKADLRTRLRAADQFWRTQGKYRDDGKDAATAEDVIQQILRVRSEGPVEIEVGQQRASGGEPLRSRSEEMRYDDAGSHHPDESGEARGGRGSLGGSRSEADREGESRNPLLD